MCAGGSRARERASDPCARGRLFDGGVCGRARGDMPVAARQAVRRRSRRAGSITKTRIAHGATRVGAAAHAGTDVRRVAERARQARKPASRREYQPDRAERKHQRQSGQQRHAGCMLLQGLLRRKTWARHRHRYDPKWPEIASRCG